MGGPSHRRCPFCGSRTLTKLQEQIGEVATFAYVACCDCGAAGPSVCVYADSGAEAIEADCWRKWNIRRHAAPDGEEQKPETEQKE